MAILAGSVDPGVTAALIGAIAVGAAGVLAFIGGYFGSRWQASGNLAQWRREKLLQYCAESLAAGGRLLDAGRGTYLGTEEPDTDDDANQLETSIASIELLDEKLAGPAAAYVLFVNRLLTVAVIKRAKGEIGTMDGLRPFVADVLRAQASLVSTARDLLIVPKRRTPWARLWPRKGPKPPTTEQAPRHKSVPGSTKNHGTADSGGGYTPGAS